MNQYHFEVPFAGWFFRSHDGVVQMVTTVSQLVYVGSMLARVVVELLYTESSVEVHAAWLEIPVVIPVLADGSYPPCVIGAEFRYTRSLDPASIVLHVPGVPDADQ